MAVNLREEMPSVAAFIDEVRLAFGTDFEGNQKPEWIAEINQNIRGALKEGADTFFASENGIEVGNKIDEASLVVPVDYVAAPIAQEYKSRGLKSVEDSEKLV